MKESTYKLQGTTVENVVIYTDEDLVVQGYSGAGKAFPRFIESIEEGENKND